MGTAMSVELDSTRPVRSGEELSTERLEAYLRQHLPAGEGALAVEQFPSGHSNLTYLLRYGDKHEYVLRRPPLGPVAPKSHDMGREYRTLSCLYKGYPLAPRAYVFCEDTAVIGAPFFVMERRTGVVVRRTIPEQFGGGCSTAKPELQTALDKFNSFKPASELHPNWGKARTEDLLKECK